MPLKPKQGENTALGLYQLIGAPLHALVDAESHAAEATAEFIERIGFTRARDGDASGPLEGELGDLRMAEFQAQRQGPDGRPQKMAVKVPLLSMLPIPALQIKDAELEFFVKIVETMQHKPRSPRSAPPPPLPTEGDQAEGEPIQVPDRVEFRASVGRSPNDSSSRSFEMQIKMKIRVEQADIPAGLARLFNILEKSVQVAPEEIPPPTEPDRDVTR